jgi:hypothetical protein
MPGHSMEGFTELMDYFPIAPKKLSLKTGGSKGNERKNGWKDGERWKILV